MLTMARRGTGPFGTPKEVATIAVLPHVPLHPAAATVWRKRGVLPQ
jgi:hypothetical protein